MNNGQSKKTWLKDDGEECYWVHRYLNKNHDRTIKNIIHEAQNYVSLDSLKGSTDGQYIRTIKIVSYLDENGQSKFVGRLKTALRQYRLRSSPVKKPCSFILPSSTKKHLSTIAKKHKKTETETIIDLINDAKNFNQSILDIQVKIANQNKQVHDIKYQKAMEEINRLATLLSEWELSMGKQDPKYEGEQETLRAETKKKTKAIKDAISYAVRRHALMQPRI